ncbi:hypothetical protein TWF281_004258 [Arthrobotrys megalospora]
MSQNLLDHPLHRTSGSSNPRSPPEGERLDLSAEILEFVDGRSPHDLIEHEPPESLLPLLPLLITHKSNNPHIATPPTISQFFTFTKTCRKTANPFKLIQSLPPDTAIKYNNLINAVLTILIEDNTSLEVLKYIFHTELKIPEFAAETEELVLTVLADLPFSLENWTNIWIGLIQGIWGAIWQTTLFVRRLKKGRVLGKSRDWMVVRKEKVEWARWNIAKRALAGGEDIGNLPRDEVSTASDKYPEAERPEIYAPLQPLRNCKSPETPSKLPNFVVPPPPKPPKVEVTVVGKRRIPNRNGRPQPVYYSPPSPAPPPSKPSSKIDLIVTKYAKLPRLKWDKEADTRQTLARQQRSEEEFNRQLKRNYNEARLRERLEELAATGLLGNDVSQSCIEDIFFSDRGGIKQNGPAVVVVEELVALHRRIVDQDREIEDDEFEKWAERLLEEGQ